MEINFTLDKQLIRRTDRNVVVSNSQNYLTAKFTLLSDDWEMPITAIFNSYAVVLNEDLTCTVPWEALVNPGEMLVSAYCGNLHTASIVYVEIQASGYGRLRESLEPTPDVYNQLIEKTNQAIQTANEAINTANSIKEDAESGEFDGESPHIGDNGNWFVGENDTGVSADCDCDLTSNTASIQETKDFLGI